MNKDRLQVRGSHATSALPSRTTTSTTTLRTPVLQVSFDTSRAFARKCLRLLSPSAIDPLIGPTTNAYASMGFCSPRAVSRRPGV